MTCYHTIAVLSSTPVIKFHKVAIFTQWTLRELSSASALCVFVTIHKTVAVYTAAADSGTYTRRVEHGREAVRLSGHFMNWHCDT